MTTTIDVADLTVDQLRDGLTAAIRATPIGHRTSYQHGPVTIEVYGASRARADLPDPTGEYTLYTPDGRYERHQGGDLTWETLHALAADIAAEWTAAVETELHELGRRHRALTRAEERAKQLRAARDEVVVSLARLGIPAAHIAAALPRMHKSTVGRILDRHSSQWSAFVNV